MELSKFRMRTHVKMIFFYYAYNPEVGLREYFSESMLDKLWTVNYKCGTKMKG